MRYIVNKLFIKIVILFCVAFIGSCFMLHAQDTFPYPAIPKEIKDADKRLSFLIEHYWDRFDFADTSLLKRNIAEQGLSDFLDILKGADSTTVNDGVKIFVNRFVCSDTASTEAQLVKEYFVGKMEQYLYDYRSPMRNDALYVSYLQTISNSPLTDTFEREHYRYIINNLQKNRLGETATDFAFTDRGGRVRRMSGFKGRDIVLFFYDPDCHSCHSEMEQMINGKSLLNSNIVVLAIYPGAETDRWERGDIFIGKNIQKSLNSKGEGIEFIDGCSIGGEILSKDIYFIRELPSVYIIDKDGRVVLKECAAKDVVSYYQRFLGSVSDF